jgi:hypothetical protein
LGRWLSQQAAEQNTSFTRPELQVLTEHLIILFPTGMGLRHIEQTNAGAGDMDAYGIHSRSEVEGRARARDQA